METLAEIALAEPLRSGAARYRFHPALLDACFHAAVQALSGGESTTAEDEVLLPINIERVQILRDVPNLEPFSYLALDSLFQVVIELA